MQFAARAVRRHRQEPDTAGGAEPRPIFLVGAPRSGTTLLSVLLHAHPNLAMPPETRFLQAVYYDRASLGDLRDPANRRRLAERVTAPPTKFKDLKLDRSAVIEAIVDGPPTLGSAFGRVWKEFATARGATRWGEKRPGYWRDMDVVLRLFPTAQVIHLVRDPRAVVASLAKVPWWDTSLAYSTSVWGQADAQLRHLGARLPPDSYHRLRYEDLVRDPRTSLERLCAYLEEEFAESMLDHVSAAHDIVPGRKTWHDRTRGPVDAGRVDAWRAVLAPADVALIETVLRRRMRRYDYRPSSPGERPEPAALGEYAYRTARIKAAITKRRVHDAALRRKVPMPLAAQL